jgi:hypothetical protein
MVMKNNRRILPVKYPSVTSWPWHACLFSVLETKKETEEWIYSNYIRMTGAMNEYLAILDFIPNVVDYAICPWIIPQLLGRKYVSEHYNDIGEFIIEAIVSGFYDYTIINMQAAIREVTGADSERRPHELYIYGYDRESGRFHVADFTFRGKYSLEEVSIDSIACGFSEIGEEEDYFALQRGGVMLMQLRSDVSCVSILLW